MTHEKKSWKMSSKGKIELKALSNNHTEKIKKPFAAAYRNVT